MTVFTTGADNREIKSKRKILQKIKIIIFTDLLMIDQVFCLPSVKRSVIISNKHSIYYLPHELKDGFRHRISGNKEISGKFQNATEL